MARMILMLMWPFETLVKKVGILCVAVLPSPTQRVAHCKLFYMSCHTSLPHSQTKGLHRSGPETPREHEDLTCCDF